MPNTLSGIRRTGFIFRPSAIDELIEITWPPVSTTK
jgi:hypothetical protein